MSRLTEGPLADVLAELLAAAQREHDERRAAPRPGPRPRDSHTDWREEFAAARHRYMAVSSETGRLLYVLARSAGARRVVEFGTSFGVSTLHLAAAVEDAGGGLVVGTEFEESKVAVVRATLARAGADGVVEVRAGDALQTLADDPVSDVDLLFLDGAKDLYGDVLTLVEPHLSPRAVVAADNVSRSRGYLDLVSDDRGWVTTVLPGSDLAVSVRA